jgi:putative transposase
MKKRFSEEQIIQPLREAETNGSNLGVYRRYRFSEQTFYHWRRKYQRLSVPACQRLKRLESENAKLKRLVAEQALAIQGLQELLANKGWPCASAESWCNSCSVQAFLHAWPVVCWGWPAPAFVPPPTTFL